jgi:hypothetical protein
MDYTEETILNAAKKLGIDVDKYDMEELKVGMSVELEHGSRNQDKNLDVTGDDPVATLQIVLAHLDEVPDYYKKLKQHVEEKLVEHELMNFDSFLSNMGEQGPPASAGLSTLSNVGTGMGAPVAPTRTSVGSGDVFSPPAKKKKAKAKKRVKSYSDMFEEESIDEKLIKDIFKEIGISKEEGDKIFDIQQETLGSFKKEYKDYKDLLGEDKAKKLVKALYGEEVEIPE